MEVIRMFITEHALRERGYTFFKNESRPFAGVWVKCCHGNTITMERMDAESKWRLTVNGDVLRFSVVESMEQLAEALLRAIR